MSATKNDGKRYISILEAAKYTGLSDDTIRNLVAMKKLSAFRPVRGRIVLDLEEIDRFVRDSEGQRSTRGPGTIQPAA